MAGYQKKLRNSRKKMCSRDNVQMMCSEVEFLPKLLWLSVREFPGNSTVKHEALTMMEESVKCEILP